MCTTVEQEPVRLETDVTHLRFTTCSFFGEQQNEKVTPARVSKRTDDPNRALPVHITARFCARSVAPATRCLNSLGAKLTHERRFCVVRCSLLNMLWGLKLVLERRPRSPHRTTDHRRNGESCVGAGIRSGPTPFVLGSHKFRPSFLFFFSRHDIEAESSVRSAPSQGERRVTTP